MSSKLEKFLKAINDNQWHNLKQIGSTLEMPEDKLREVVSFLTETDLIQHDQKTNQIKLNQNWKTLFIGQKEAALEKRQQSETIAFGTMIIPPQKTLIIQCTRITNLTENSLELEMRINKKLREIAISKIR